MNRKLNGISLLLLMIMMAVSVLAVLSVVSARSDLKKSKRQAAYNTGVQQCMNEGQLFLAETDSAVKQGLYDEGTILEKTLTDGNGRILDIRLLIKDGSVQILEWKNSTEWPDDAPMGNLLVVEESESGN